MNKSKEIIGIDVSKFSLDIFSNGKKDIIVLVMIKKDFKKNISNVC